MWGRRHVYLALTIFFQRPLGISGCCCRCCCRRCCRRCRGLPFVKAPRFGIKPFLGGIDNGRSCFRCDCGGCQSRKETSRPWPTEGSIKSLFHKVIIDRIDIIQRSSIVSISISTSTTRSRLSPRRHRRRCGKGRSKGWHVKKGIPSRIQKGHFLNLQFRRKNLTLRGWNLQPQQPAHIR